MSANTVNYVLYQVGWFACILGAAWRQEVAGVVIALVLMAVHLWLSQEREVEVRLIATALLVGTIVESVQGAAGTYTSTTVLDLGGNQPIWLLTLWAQFAITFRYCLRAVVARPWAALVFGACGGPLAFFAADRLGALTLLPPLGEGLLRISVAWTIALLLFSWVTRKWSAGADGRYRRLPGRAH